LRDTLRALCFYILNTARNEVAGQEAVKKLNGEGLKPKYHQLDITDQGSVDRLAQFLQSTYGGLDVLVNNAGIAFKVCLYLKYMK